MHKTHVAALLLAAALFLVLPAPAANTITFDPASVTIPAGSTATIVMTVDSLPEGLSGYGGHITITDPGIATITNVSYPGWAVLSNTTGLPSGRIRVSIVDLNHQVEAGATNVDLATVTVQGNAPGTTTLALSDVKFDADGGAMISPLAAPVAITVPGADGGSGSGGATYEPVPVGSYVSDGTAASEGFTVTFETQAPTIPGASGGSGGGGGSVTTYQTVPAGQATSPAAPVTSQVTTPAAATPNPGVPAAPALPLTYIAGGVIVLVVIAFVVYLTVTKKI